MFGSRKSPPSLAQFETQGFEPPLGYGLAVQLLHLLGQFLLPFLNVGGAGQRIDRDYLVNPHLSEHIHRHRIQHPSVDQVPTVYPGRFEDGGVLDPNVPGPPR